MWSVLDDFWSWWTVVLKMLKIHSGGQGFGELVITVRNTSMNPVSFGQFAFHQVDMSKVFFLLPFFMSTNALMDSSRACYVMTSVFMTSISRRIWGCWDNLKIFSHTIPQTCAKIAYSILPTKHERVTRCLQHLQNSNHVRRANGGALLTMRYTQTSLTAQFHKIIC